MASCVVSITTDGIVAHYSAGWDFWGEVWLLMVRALS